MEGRSRNFEKLVRDSSIEYFFTLLAVIKFSEFIGNSSVSGATNVIFRAF